ncbi:MAG: NAD-dependent deacylase [Candidatus Omnitrophota bacterium]
MLREAEDFIKNNFKKESVVCLTGAGISAESGIPVFRGAGGLWEKYDPESYAYPEGLLSILRNRPGDLVNFIVDFYSLLIKARPNPAHLALAILEKEGILRSVITQNVDNLHQSSGLRSVIELHGNAFRIRCPACSHTIVLEKERLKEMTQLLKMNRNSRVQLLKTLSRYFPRCSCGARHRIDIVLFGEMLPEEAMACAYKQLDDCKVLLLVGTSLVVYPAASLPLYAKERGSKLIEINDEPSALSDLCDYRLNGKVSSILPDILTVLGYV